jgi:metal-responsive CopG/Arc/MetJ family transcriptional regulator
MNEKRIKTSVTLRESLLKRVEEYRASKRPIPTRSEAVELLVNKGLKEDKKKPPLKVAEVKKDVVPLKA